MTKNRKGLNFDMSFISMNSIIILLNSHFKTLQNRRLENRNEKTIMENDMFVKKIKHTNNIKI
jgi:hypothetical protein